MYGQRILEYVIPAWVQNPALGEPWFGNALETKRKLQQMRGAIGRDVQSASVSDNRLMDELLNESRIEHGQRFNELISSKKRLRHMRLFHPQGMDPIEEPDNCLRDQLLDENRITHVNQINHLAVEYWTHNSSAQARVAC